MDLWDRLTAYWEYLKQKKRYEDHMSGNDITSPEDRKIYQELPIWYKNMPIPEPRHGGTRAGTYDAMPGPVDKDLLPYWQSDTPLNSKYYLGGQWDRLK